MATIASKIQWTTAAFAVAAAATLVPVAFADPTDPDTGDTTGAAVGSAAGQAPTRSTRKDRPRVNDDAAGTQAGGNSANTGSTSAAGSPVGSESQAGRDSTEVSAPETGTSESSPETTTSAPDTTTSPTTPTTDAPLAVGDDVTIIEVPLVADPDLQAATFGWMKDLNFEACVLGLTQSIRGTQSVAIGPYGTSSLTFKTQGCG